MSTQNRVTTATRRGLTVIEMLLVCVIMAVLAGLVLPAFAAVRKETRMTTCRSHLRQLGMAIEQYVSDYGAYPNPIQLVESVKDKRILRCPEDDGHTPSASSYTFRSMLPPNFQKYWELPELDPNTVLVICRHHLERQESLQGDRRQVGEAQYPKNLVLRAAGAVQPINEADVQEVFVPGDRPTFVRIYPGEPGYKPRTR
jgi:type II secretory pathway pseudopilin PulG